MQCYFVYILYGLLNHISVRNYISLSNILKRSNSCSLAMTTTHVYISANKETLRFVQKVRSRFLLKPETFSEFRRILSHLNIRCSDTGDRQLEQVAEIAALFHDHPDLFTGFMRFLPAGYTAELQHDSILLHRNASPQAIPDDRLNTCNLPRKWQPTVENERGCGDLTKYNLPAFRLADNAESFRRSVQERCTDQVYAEFRSAFRECFSSCSDRPQEILSRIIVILHEHSDLIDSFQRLFHEALSSHSNKEHMQLIEYLGHGLYEVKGEPGDDSMFIMVDANFISNKFI